MSTNKGKGDNKACRKIELTLSEHGITVYKGVLGKRFRKLIDIGSYEFRFCPGRSTKGAIFNIRQLQVKNIKSLL